MAAKSKIKHTRMIVDFHENGELEVSFINWRGVTPSRIDRSYNFQQSAWETLKREEIQRVNMVERQKSFDHDIAIEQEQVNV